MWYGDCGYCRKNTLSANAGDSLFCSWCNLHTSIKSQRKQLIVKLMEQCCAILLLWISCFCTGVLCLWSAWNYGWVVMFVGPVITSRPYQEELQHQWPPRGRGYRRRSPPQLHAGRWGARSVLPPYPTPSQALSWWPGLG